MVDYEYYVREYGGNKIDEPASFNRLYMRAKSSVDRYTFNRCDSVRDDKLIRLIKFTICLVIDIYSDHQDRSGKGLRGQTVGEFSVTYEEDSGEDGLQREVYLMIRESLMSTGLMYRGL